MIATRILIFVGFVGGLVWAQEADRLRNPSANPDSAFVVTAASSGMAEVQLGTLAKDHAASMAVKDFGARMVVDHTRANDQLKALAAAKNILFPADLSDEAKAASARLSKLSGNEFDAAFMNRMVQDHQATVILFQQEASDGLDTDIKAWSAHMLPTLQEHLKRAQDILANMGR